MKHSGRTVIRTGTAECTGVRGKGETVVRKCQTSGGTFADTEIAVETVLAVPENPVGRSCACGVEHQTQRRGIL